MNLTDDSRAILAELNRDAMPTMDEQVRDHFDIASEDWDAMGDDERDEKREELKDFWMDNQLCEVRR